MKKKPAIPAFFTARKRRAYQTALAKWIDKVGAPDVAKLLRVEPSAVRHWRRGQCLPRYSEMLLIRKYSRGSVTCDRMIIDFSSLK